MVVNSMTAWFRRIPLFMACGILIWFLCDPIQVRETVSDALALCAGNFERNGTVDFAWTGGICRAVVHPMDDAAVSSARKCRKCVVTGVSGGVSVRSAHSGGTLPPGATDTHRGATFIDFLQQLQPGVFHQCTWGRGIRERTHGDMAVADTHSIGTADGDVILQCRRVIPQQCREGIPQHGISWYAQ